MLETAKTLITASVTSIRLEVGIDMGKEIHPVEGRLGKEIHALEDTTRLESDQIKKSQ